MNILELEGVRVAGVSAALPPREIDNVAALSAIYGEKAAGIVKATGIVKRRVVDEGVSSLDLCVCAARRMLAEMGVDKSEFGAILCVSFTPARQMPGNAIQAQRLLEFDRDIIAFDINLACSGYGYGLYMAGLLARQMGKKVLLLDGDVQTAFMRQDDAATVPVMADAGTATIVEPQVGGATWKFAFLADGAKGDVLILPHGGTISMDGFGIFKFVSMDVSKFIREFMTAIDLKPEAIDAFVPHQANIFMIRQLAKLLKIDPAKLWVSGDVFGNSSSATVPVTLAFVGQREARDRQVLFSGFGGGLSASVGLVSIDKDCYFTCFDYGCN